MIVVDSSVWIDLLRDRTTRGTDLLKAEVVKGTILLGDVILAEILMGARDDLDARKLLSKLSRFPRATMLGPSMAVQAARNYRVLRAVGITIRKTTDLFIGTFCIANGHTLLHRDRDFVGMEKHLGLKVL